MAKCTPAMAEIIQQEVSRILKSKQPARVEQVNFAQMDEFAGKTFKDFLLNGDLQKWIIDTGTTNHICAVRNMFDTLKPLAKPILIHLPDGSTKSVQFYGNVQLHETLCLRSILYIPSFKHNLLSVSRLTKTNDLKLRPVRLLLWAEKEISYTTWIKDPSILMLPYWL